MSAKENVVVYLVGDVGPRRIEYGEDPKTLMAASRDKLAEADIRFCQLERTLSTLGAKQNYNANTWYAQVHPDNIGALTHVKFDVASMAGNHNGDWGYEPIVDTVEFLKRNGIVVVGAGKDLASARRPAIFERKGTKIAFLAYCSILPPGLAAGSNKPGVAPIEVATYYEPPPTARFQPGVPPKVITIPNADHVAAMVKDVQEAKKAADVVIVSLHYGIPWIPGVIAQYQPVISRAAIDAGAELVFGHHPHVIKGIEVYKGKVIFYSAGDFAQETPHHQKKGDDVTGLSTFNIKEFREQGSRPNDDPKWARFMGPVERRYSMIVNCQISKKKIEKVSFFPVYINERAEPEPLKRSDPRFEEVAQFITKYATEQGTKLSPHGDEIVVQT